MKKNVIITVVVLIFSLVGIILGNKSFAYQNVKEKSWNVYFENLKTSIINGSAFVPVEPELESTSVKAYDVLISKRGDYALFTFDIINDGDIDAKISTLTKIEPKCISLEIPANEKDEKLVCSNLEYKIYYTKNNKEVGINDVLKSHTKENVTVKVGLSNSISSDPQGEVQVTLFDTTIVYNY